MFVLVLWPIAHILSQAVPREFYKIKVVLNDGQRLGSFINSMTDSTLTVSGGDGWGNIVGGTVTFTDIKRVIIKRASKKKSRTKGAIAGGLITGLVVYNNAHQNQLRSPTISVVNATLTIAVGAGLGLLAGHLIGNTSRVVVRPVGTDPETIARSIRLQLEPFSYDYQQRLMQKANN